MEFPIAVYVRANSPYWFHVDPENPQDARLVMLSTLPTFHDANIGTWSSTNLQAMGFKNLDNTEYFAYADHELIALLPKRSHFFGTASPPARFLKLSGEGIAERFRSKTKSRLFQDLAAAIPSFSPEQVIRAFCTYTFFDDFAAWLHNPITKTYTRIAASIPAKQEFCKDSESDRLQTLLSNPEVHLKQSISNPLFPDEFGDRDIAWVNCFTATTAGDQAQYGGMRVALCMYSSNS